MQRGTRAGGLAAAVLALSVTAAAIAQEQDVTIVLNEEPANLDPCEVASDFIGRVALNNIFEALTPN
jgi:ABC-type transport system substrate-binding protein